MMLVWLVRKALEITLCRMAVQSPRRYFVSQAINAEDKDSALRLTSNFIWEVDELDGTIRRSDVAALKAFITRRVVEARPAYARYDIEASACASLIGTVNLGTGFLADATGNRRFYVATISAIDWAYTQHDVNQAWPRL
jgi:putative DNA primase/helicase